MKQLVVLCFGILLTAVAVSCKNDSEKKQEIDQEKADQENLATPEVEDSVPTVDPIMETEMEEDTTAIWSRQYFYSNNSDDADIQVRVGDVDNLGFGWDPGFDPFCGKNTSVHRYPWDVDSTDHLGTDRIMVVSGYRRARSDGYTSRTLRAHTDPIKISMEYDPPEMKIEKLVLQMMLDDFQAPVWGNSFQFHIDDKRLTYVEDVINYLRQTGPTGKLVQIGILPEDFEIFTDGSIEISIDDPLTDAGDGFAIDFVQLLINPKGEYKCTGTITGLVKDEQNKPIEGALVSANGLVETLTAEDGTFELTNVPVGMLSVIGNKQGYEPDSDNFELSRGTTEKVTLTLKQKEAEDESFLAEEIKEKGFVNLYGILFDSGKDIPKEESESVLNELANFVKNNADLQIEIIGHTDSDGDNVSNEDLSRRRAQSVKEWLDDQNIDVKNIRADGKGESSPVASNASDEGKALNRRVEVRVIQSIDDTEQ